MNEKLTGGENVHSLNVEQMLDFKFLEEENRSRFEQ